MAQYQSFLMPQYDRDFFMNPSRWPFGTRTAENILAKSLYRLLQAGKANATEDVEDKIEVNHKFYMSLQPILGLENDDKTDIVLDIYR
jgi:hypothetical protein